MRGGPRVVSPAVNWHESEAKKWARSVGPISDRPGGKARVDSTGGRRLAAASLRGRKAARTGVAFCSGRTDRARTGDGPLKKAVSEGDKPICCASQTVKVTVKATANPVHLLLRSSVALGFAKCTDGASACPMPRVYGAKSAGWASGNRGIFVIVTRLPCTDSIQHGSFWRAASYIGIALIYNDNSVI